MENYVLKIKQALLNEIEIKKKILNSQSEKCTYIEIILKELEEKFDKLMNQEIKLNDFLKYINSLDNEIIFESSTENLRSTIERLLIPSYKGNSYIMNQFYDELTKLSNYLKKIAHNKKTETLLKKQEIDKLLEYIENIDDNGLFINPINETSLNELKKTPCLMQLFNTENTTQIYFEIAIKNTQAIKKQLEKIAKRRKIIEKTQEKEKENDKELFENAKTIIKTKLNEIGTLTETEEEYLKDLINITNVTEIITAIELMEEKESSLRLIIYGLKNALEQKKLDKKIIETYLNLYNKYKIIEKKENKELILLLKEYNEIKENNEDLTSDLTEQQQLELKAFENIDGIDEKTLHEIDTTLKKSGLNVEFLMLYNKYLKIQNKIEEYEEFEEILEDEEKIKMLENIKKEYEKYEEIKQQYIEKTKFEKQYEEEKEDNDNILLFLTDENGITYAQKQMESSKQFGEYEANCIIQLLKEMKTNNSTYIHTIAKKVKPEESDYKKKRLSQGNTRLIFIPVSNKPLNTDKPVYLIITAGTKTSATMAPVYLDANHLKPKVLDYINYYTNTIGNLSDEEKEQFIKYNKELEHQLTENILTFNQEKIGGKSNEK